MTAAAEPFGNELRASSDRSGPVPSGPVPGGPGRAVSSRHRRDTVVVRGGEPQRHGYAAVATPIVCTATYRFDGSGENADHFGVRILG